ncbi:MAG: Rrf2 family transcriptional regulator [Acidiferrobacterales bacterium]
MKISRKARFAVSAMIRLGLRGDQGTKTLTELSMDQGISLSYLEQLFAQMRRKGIVVGVRGPGGGYRLAKPSSEIDIASIISAVEDQQMKSTGSDKLSDESNYSDTQSMWDDLSHQLQAYLGTVTLADVIHSDANGSEHRKVA